MTMIKFWQRSQNGAPSRLMKFPHPIVRCVNIELKCSDLNLRWVQCKNHITTMLKARAPLHLGQMLKIVSCAVHFVLASADLKVRQSIATTIAIVIMDTTMDIRTVKTMGTSTRFTLIQITHMGRKVHVKNQKFNLVWGLKPAIATPRPYHAPL